MIDKEEEAFYRNVEKTDDRIHVLDIDGEDFLYLNWDKEKQPSLEEIQELVRTSKKTDVSHMEEPEDVRVKKCPMISSEETDKRTGTKTPYWGYPMEVAYVFVEISNHIRKKVSFATAPKILTIVLDCLNSYNQNRYKKRMLPNV